MDILKPLHQPGLEMTPALELQPMDLSIIPAQSIPSKLMETKSSSSPSYLTEITISIVYFCDPTKGMHAFKNMHFNFID